MNSSIDKWVQSNSTPNTYEDTLGYLKRKLASNQVASSATQEMLNINNDIAELEERLENLPKEAKSHFKGDVPQYIVDAYVSNNTQKIQSELNKLQSRYNSALDLYKTELSNAQREAEMELKEKQLELQANQQAFSQALQTRSQAWTEKYQGQQLQNQANQQAWTQYYQNESLKLSRIKTDANGRPYTINGDGTITYLTDNTYDLAVQEQVQT